MKQKFNIYCDESSVENPNLKYMVIGSLIIPRYLKNEIAQKIKAIYLKNKISKEIKWNRVDKKYFPFYKDLLELFITTDDLHFRCVVVDKSKIKYELHNFDKELAFFKFYYFLLRGKLENDGDYYIFLDKKPTRDRNRTRSLKSFLDSYTLFKHPASKIKHFQSYDSAENLFIQIADFLTGLFAYTYNYGSKNSVKGEISKLAIKHLNINLTTGSKLSEEKLNIFLWRPNG